jgi:undecaprenyl-diphosphatase
MIWTVVFLLAMFAILLLFRLIAWRSLRLARHLFRKGMMFVKEIWKQGNIWSPGSRLNSRFPQATAFFHNRLTPNQFTGLPLTLTVAAALYVAALLGGLVEELFEADELVRFDQWFNQQLDTLRIDGIVSVFSWVTDLGGSAALAAVVFVTTGLLWVHGHGYMIAPLWLSLLGSQITTYTGKYVIARPRPEFVTEVIAVTPSFPSGHATSAMAVYGFVAYIITSNLADLRTRFEVIYWAAVLIGLVGFSRMLLSVHYASDVAAGFLVGGFWLLLGFAFSEYMRRHTGN